MSRAVVTHTYRLNKLGKVKRQATERKLFSQGWTLYEEKFTSKYSFGKALGLGCLFLPLALLGKNKVVEVTYEKI